MYGTVLVVLAYLLFIAVFTHHLFRRFPKAKKLFIRMLPSKVNNLLHGRPYHRREEPTIQETDEAPLDITHSEISISQDEKEEDEQNSNRELQEHEDNTATVTDVKAEPHAVTNSYIRTSMKSKLRDYQDSLHADDFSEVREPLLAEDDTMYY